MRLRCYVQLFGFEWFNKYYDLRWNAIRPLFYIFSLPLHLKSKDTQRLRQIIFFISSFFFRIFAGNFVKEDVLPFMMRRVKI